MDRMLVLSRKQNEEIIIDGQIRITVVEISGGRVKLGVSAPLEIPVHRAELNRRLRPACEQLTEPQPCAASS
jgi:carbon storage regulator